MILDLADKRMRVAITFAVAFGAVDLIVSLLGGILAGVMAGTIGAFATFTFFGWIAGALVIAIVLMNATDGASKMLDDLAAEEVNKLIAQRESLERAQVSQINVNAPGGTLNVKNKPITYRVNGQAVSAGQFNQVVVKEEQRVIQVPDADVLWMLEQFRTTHAKRTYLGRELPYSRQKITWEMYCAIVDPLTAAGKIVGRGSGASGQLVEKDTRELKRVIDAKYPGGVKILLPATTQSGS